MHRNNRKGKSDLPQIPVSRLLLWGLFIFVIILQITYDPQDDFTKFYDENQATPMGNTDTQDIKIDTSLIQKGKSLKGMDDPNNPEYADPTDMQAEDEGYYEDNSEDFNGKLR